MDEHMSEEQLTTAAAALRQRKEILQCLGRSCAQQEEEEVQRAA